MGMFDTVHFPQPVTCVDCGAPITETQTKAFESMLEDYHIGDCIGHAEEMRIVRESLYCDACPAIDKQFVYFVVYRGILVDVALDLATAEAQLHSVPTERLILWYHDQYAKRMAEQSHRHGVTRFLHELTDWYVDGYEQMTPKQQRTQRLLILHGGIFKQTDNPVEAVRLYLEQLKDDTDDADTESA